MKLLRGAPEGLSSLRVEGLECSLDFALPKGPPEEGAPAPWPSLPSRLPRIEAFGVNAVAALPEGRAVALEGASLRVSPSEGGERVSLSIPRFRFSDPAAGEREGGFEARLRYAAGRVEAEDFRWNGESIVERGTLDGTALADGRLSFDLALALFGGRVALEGRLRDGACESEVAVSAVRLESALAALDPASDPAASGTIDLSGSVRFPVKNPLSGEADFRLAGVGLRVEGEPIDRVEAEVRVAEGLASLGSLEVLQGRNRLRADLLEVPVERFGLEAILESASARWGIEARDLPALLPGGPAAAGERVPEHLLSLRGSLGGGVFALEEGEFETPGGHLHLRTGRVVWSRAEGASEGSLALVLDLEADFEDLVPLGSILETEPWGGNLAGAIAVDGVWPRVAAQASLEGEGVVAAGIPLGRVRLRAAADSDSLRVEILEAESEAAWLSLSGAWRFDEDRIERATLSAAVRRPERFGDRLPFEGEVSVEADLSGPPRALSGRLEARGERVSLLGAALEGVALASSARDGVWEVEALRADTPAGRLDVRGRVTGAFVEGPLRIALDDLRLSRGEFDLALASPASIEIAGDGARVEGFDLVGTAGELRVSMREETGRAQWRATLVRLDPSPFLEPFLPRGLRGAGIDATFRAIVAGGETEILSEGRVASMRWAPGAPDLEVLWKGGFGKGTVAVEQFEARSGETVVLALAGAAPIDPGKDPLLGEGPVALRGTLAIPSGANLPFRAAGRALRASGRLAANFEVLGTWRVLEGRIDLDAETLVVEAADGGERLLGPASLQASVALGGDAEIERVHVVVPDRGEADLRGRVGFPLDAVSWLERGISFPSDTPLALEGEVRVEDLAWLARHVGGIRRIAGGAEVRGAVGGTLGDPRWRGEVEVRDGELRLASDFPAFGAIRARLRLEGTAVVLEALEGELGGAPFRVEGKVALEGPSPALDLRLRGENLLLQRTSATNLRADADLRIAGPIDALETEGTIAIRGGRFSRNTDLLAFARGGSRRPTARGLQIFSFREPPLSTTRFDVIVETKEPLRVNNNLARGAARFDLHLGGTGEVPVPSGRLLLDPTRVRLPGGVVEFSTGTVTFEEGDPFVPTLDLLGETRIAGYDVRMHVTGRYDEPEVVLSSVPPLPSDELLLLVVAGERPKGRVTQVGAQAAQSVAVYLTQDLVRMWSSGGWEESDESVFDRMEVTTGRDVSKSGVQTTEAKLRLARALLAERDVLYLAAEKDVFEDYNFGLRVVFRFR